MLCELLAYFIVPGLGRGGGVVVLTQPAGCAKRS